MYIELFIYAWHAPDIVRPHHISIPTQLQQNEVAFGPLRSQHAPRQNPRSEPHSSSLKSHPRQDPSMIERENRCFRETLEKNPLYDGVRKDLLNSMMSALPERRTDEMKHFWEEEEGFRLTVEHGRAARLQWPLQLVRW